MSEEAGDEDFNPDRSISAVRIFDAESGEQLEFFYDVEGISIPDTGDMISLDHVELTEEDEQIPHQDVKWYEVREKLSRYVKVNDRRDDGSVKNILGNIIVLQVEEIESPISS